jgi:sulfoxide reductase catalytic subunit YedY
MVKIHPSEITPEHLYLSRRRFLKGMGALATSALVLSACGGGATPSPTQPADAGTGTGTDELTDELTSENDINSYNNFYEFSLGKTEVAPLALDGRGRRAGGQPRDL